VAAPPLDSPCNGLVTYPGDTKVLKRKKRTDTQYDNKARFDGQRFGKLKVATWNVRGNAEKKEELQTELLKRKINVAIITETKKKNKGSEDIGNYVTIYCGVPANQWASSGVAIAVRKDWKHKIQDCTWILDRIIETRIKVLNRNFTVVGVYVPVEGKEQDTEEFYRELQRRMDIIRKNENITLAGGFNGGIANQPIPECIGTYGEQVTNHNRAALRDFCAFNKLRITNSFYRHKDIHKFTWESRGNKPIIDYIIINDGLKSNIEDTRVFRGSEIDSDHKLVES